MQFKRIIAIFKPRGERPHNVAIYQSPHEIAEMLGEYETAELKDAVLYHSDKGQIIVGHGVNYLTSVHVSRINRYKRFLIENEKKTGT